MESKRLLIVDDEDQIRGVVADFLADEGFLVTQASSGREGLELLSRSTPDLILLDVGLPDMSGYDVCKKIREQPATRHTPVIMFTAHTLDKDEVTGFDAGADDYIPKPFKPARLLARITAAIGRTVRELDANALTHLPGNRAIIDEIQKRILAGGAFSVLYFDLNNFKAFNDRYGFIRGDQAIKLTAEILQRQATSFKEASTFTGHIGGDDFVIIVDAHDPGKLCVDIIREFDTAIPGLYDEDDRARGMITSVDRRGNKIDFPLMGIAIAVVTNRHKTFSHPGEVALIAGDLKKWVKSATGSAYVVDRRS
jgi:diguanylate cyclase (GGDEF)-like protein